ncbi:alpha/beta hydrolase [Paraburkholderia strydomiana]|uniref:alpha/beta hydrolase n=1 Tax=Paraburkholderia strydomiana TaxID=1245417 RepID=UPI0028547DA2|nr:alpha/beta hydrolase fold domain-containing protein [Paraburkholderia strydomiana]MDR7006220.1 hypothetical protein [Paraburkholderia strydomiana]
MPFRRARRGVRAWSSAPAFRCREHDKPGCAIRVRAAYPMPIFPDSARVRLRRPLTSAIVYLHSGYHFGSPATHRAVTTALAYHRGPSAFALDYRLARERPFPAALEDALLAYRTLIGRGISADSIGVAGDSARANSRSRCNWRGAKPVKRCCRRRAVFSMGRLEDDVALGTRHRPDHGSRDAARRAHISRRLVASEFPRRARYIARRPTRHELMRDADQGACLT